MRNVYNTGKVKIGLTYEPKHKIQILSQDMHNLQSALLGEKKAYHLFDKAFFASLAVACISLLIILGVQ
jgi:hypothetical protein